MQFLWTIKEFEVERLNFYEMLDE